MYREIRVRPVVRYVITDYSMDEDKGTSSSSPLGMFENVDSANRLAAALALDIAASGDPAPVLEPARQLRIEWLRGPGEPKEAIRWELIEV